MKHLILPVKTFFLFFLVFSIIINIAEAQEVQEINQNEENGTLQRNPVNEPYPDLVLPKSANSAIAIQKYTGTDQTNPNHPEKLVTDLLISGCLQATNISFRGNRNQIGRFVREADNPNFPLESGIILSTGNVSSAIGANESGSTTAEYSLSGEGDLQTLIGVSQSNILDPAVLTFDFIPDGDIVEFRYIFASEEYPEWACSQYNDVFGFFISGPGITGPFSNGGANIALLPDGSPVSINNIHVGGWNQNAGQSSPNPGTCPDTNAAYYVAVPAGSITIEYDGRTTVLTARIEGLQACATYSMKIAIADVADRKYDSAVFLEAKSFTSSGNINIKNFYNDIESYDVFQACGPNEIRFFRDAESDINDEVSIPYEIVGTAVAGTHYSGISSGTATIPSGQEYISIPYTLPLVSIDDTKTMVVRVNVACACDDTPQWVERVIRIHDPFEVKEFTTVAQSSCDQNNGSLTILSGSGNSSYDYVFTYELYNSSNQLVNTLSSGANIPLTFPNLGSDSYTIRITEATSCHVIITDPIVIEGPDSPVLTISSNSPVCEGQTIELTSVSETSGLSYSWSGPNGFLSDQANPGITNATTVNSGNYSLTITAPNHCTATRGVDVIVNALPSVTITGNEIIDCENTMITLVAAIDDDVTFLWNNGATESEIDVTEAGDYSVTVTTANGCTASDMVTVIKDVAAPVVTHDPIDPICIDQLPVYLGSGLYSGNGVYESNGEFFFSADEAGEYTVIYTEIGENGCEGSTNIEITVLALPLVTCPEAITIGLIAAPITLSGAEPLGGTYTGAGVVDGIFDPMVASVGEHLITYTFEDGNGCANFCSFTITVVSMPDFACIPDFGVCNSDDAFELEQPAYAGGVYSGPGVENNVFDPQSLDPGAFEITYTFVDEFGFTYTCTFYITVYPAAEVSLEAFAPVCTNAPAFALEGGYPTNGIYSGEGVIDGIFYPETLVAGTYEITYSYTNENGCSGFAIQPIEVMQTPCVEITHTDVSCNGDDDGTITVDVTCGNPANICLIFPNGEQNNHTDKTNAVYSGLMAGTYQVVVTDVNGCIVVTEVTIEEPELLAAIAEVTQPLCHDDSGMVEINISGGTEPYEIHWGEINPMELAEGDYEIAISDAHGCSTQVNFSITNPEPLNLTAEITHLTTFNDGTGAISVTVTGGTPPYDFLWDNGAITSTIENLQAGTYFVTVIDDNGCLISAEYVVNEGGIAIDLSVTIEVNIQTPDPEEINNLIFALVVRNHNEEEDASGVVVNNPMPVSFPFIERLDDGTSGSFDPVTGLWNIGIIPAGEHVILVYRTQMLLSEEGTQFDTNTAQILPFDQIDPYLVNNYAEIVVTIGESSGGDDNGIESNGSMASQLALRNHRRLVESHYIPRAQRRARMVGYSHTGMLIGNLKSSTAEGYPETGISMLLPEEGPAETRAYISTPADLLGITNAKEIFAVDYLQQNNARRAAVLAISTEPSRVYEHTKVICDRLMGAELRDIKMIEIAGRPFILSQLVHPNGHVDYSVSFIAQRKGGQFEIDNRWYNEEYNILNSDDIFNFQVWSVTPQFTRELVEDILTMMEQSGGISFRNETITPQIPQVFVHSGRYTNGGLLLNLVNKAGADQITIRGNKTTFENAQRETMNLTVNLPAGEFVEVFVPTGYIFDAGFSLTNNKHDAPDVLYYADGAWMFDYDPGNATVAYFETFAENAERQDNQYKVERDASFRGDVRTWASMFRSLSPRNMPVDLSTFNEVKFNASGKGTIEVMLAKAGVNSWSEQYRATVTLDENTREYTVKFRELVTREGERGFTGEDVVSVIFNPIGNESASTAFEVNVSNLHFSNSNFTVKSNATFYPAYPNPFRNKTNIDLMVTVDNHVKAEVLNTFGQVVDILVNEELSTGDYKLSWEAARHQPGVYMIRITVGNDTYSTKVIHQK